MPVRKSPSLALIALAIVGALTVACFGGGNGGSTLDLGSVPTATLPAQLPEAVIVSESDAPTTGGEDTTYVVVSGDSPGSIADQFGISVEDLMAANGITDPTALQVGQELVIPGGGSAPESDVLGESNEPEPTPEPVFEEPAPTEPAVTTDDGVYIVQEGDIPETIAAQFGITAEELMAANGITDPTALQVGQELVIPAPAE